MPIRTFRQRVRPQFNRGFRLGKERNSGAEWLERHPEIKERLFRTIARLDALGVGRADMRRVKQPFDYD